MWGREQRAEREAQERREEIRRLFGTPPAPALPWWQTVLAGAVSTTGDLRRLAWRARRVLAPFVALAVVGGAGLVVHLRDVPPVGAGLLAVLAAAAWWWRRAEHLDRRVERRYAAVCLAASCGWLVWAAVVGPWWTPLATGWVVLALPWLRHHWPRPRVDVPDVEPLGDPIIALWDAHVADQQGALPGSRLVDPTPFEHGTEYRVLLVPGRQPLDTVRAAHPRLAQGIRTPAHRVVVEQHPDTEDPAVGRLRHVAVSPVRDTQWLQRPRWDDRARIMLGPHADGMGSAVWRTYVRNGLYGGLIVGSQGHGKTRLMESLAVATRAMSAATWPTVTVYVDGQDGASSPLLWRHATLRCGPDDLGEMLDALARVMRLRQQFNRVHGLAGFTPGASPDGGRTPGLPGVLVYADEFHRLTADKAHARAWTSVAREGRKVGLAVIAGDQDLGLDVFGGMETLRACLLAGNGLAFHVASSTTGGLVPGFSGVRPENIPAIPGFAYKVAAPHSGERTAPFRASYMPDEKDRDDHPDLPVPTVEEWFERTSDAPLDDMTARAFGSLYADREGREARARAAALAEIEGTAPQGPSEGGGVGERAVITSPGKRTTADVIMDLLGESPRKRDELAALVEAEHGTGKDAVKQALQRLLADRRVLRTGHGMYERVDAGKVAA